MSRFEDFGVEYLQFVVSQSSSFADVLRRFEYAVSSDAYRLLKRTLQRNEIDYSHISIGVGSNKGRIFGPKKDIREYLIENSNTDNAFLKKRLIQEGLMKNECCFCGQEPMWQGKPLSLQLDHMNGNKTDNRLDNLRLLCPNCHTQTETHSGKNRSNKCKDCNKRIGRSTTRCQKCANQSMPRLVKFDIDPISLAKLVWSKPTVEIAKDFGVSDVAIAKRCRKFGIQKPPRGYWTSKQRWNTCCYD